MDTPSFKRKYTLNERKKLSSIMLAKDQRKVPVLLLSPQNTTTFHKEEKFICPKDSAFTFFIIKVRKYIELSDTQALFFMSYKNGKTRLINPSQTIGEVYNLNKDEDGFLYIVYTTEDTFG